MYSPPSLSLSLSLCVCVCGCVNALSRLLQLFGEWFDHGQIIVFVSKQVEADELFKELMEYGYGKSTSVLHGGQDQTDRDFTIQDFKVKAPTSPPSPPVPSPISPLASVLCLIFRMVRGTSS